MMRPLPINISRRFFYLVTSSGELNEMSLSTYERATEGYFADYNNRLATAAREQAGQLTGSAVVSEQFDLDQEPVQQVSVES